MIKQALENSTVRIASAAIVIVFVGGLIAGEVAYRVNTARDIRAIEGHLQQIKTESWLRSHQRLWVAETQILNPDWRGSSIDVASQQEPSR